MGEVKIEVIVAVQDALTAVDKVEKSGVSAADKITSAWAVLNVQSTASMDEAKNRISTAYDQIKNSGLATADEITRAEAARAKAIEKIDTDNLATRKGLMDQLHEHWLGVTAAMTAAYLAAQQAMDYVKLAASAQQAGQSFDIVAKSWGVDGDALLSKMKEVSSGMMTEADLQQQAVKMMQQGVSGDQIVGTLQVAVGAARTAGVNLRDSFEQIGTAEADLMVRGLKHMGIVIDQTKAIKDYAEKNGILVDSLTEQQKSQALVNAVLEKGGQQLNALGAIVANASDDIQKQTTSWEELKVMLGNGIMAVIKGVEAGFYLMAAGAVEAYAYTLKLDAAMRGLIPGDSQKQKIQELNEEFKVANKTVDALGQAAHEMWNDASNQAYASEIAAQKEAEAKTKLAEATGKAKQAQDELNKAANDKAISQFIDEWQRKIIEMDPLLDEYTKKLIDFQAEMAKLKDEKGDVKDKNGNSIIDALTKQGLADLNAAQDIAYKDLMNSRLDKLQQELAKEDEAYQENVRKFGDTEQHKTDLLALHAQNRLEIEAKAAKDGIDKQLKVYETLRTAMVSTYDAAIKEAQAYYDLAAKIGDQVQKNAAWKTNFTGKSQTPDEQFYSDYAAMKKTVSNDAFNMTDATATQKAIDAATAFMDKYKSYSPGGGSNTFEMNQAMQSFDELQSKLKGLQSADEQAGNAWTRVANQQIQAIQSVDQWIQYLSSGIQQIDTYLEKQHTFDLNTSGAVNNLNQLLSQIELVNKAMASASNGGIAQPNSAVSNAGSSISSGYDINGNFWSGNVGQNWNFNTPDLPLMANGGYVTKPTAVILGDDGPEYAVPEAKMQAIMSGSGRGITVNLGGITIQAATDPATLARQIVKPIRDELIRLKALGGSNS